MDKDSEEYFRSIETYTEKVARLQAKKEVVRAAGFLADLRAVEAGYDHKVSCPIEGTDKSYFTRMGVDEATELAEQVQSHLTIVCEGDVDAATFIYSQAGNALAQELATPESA
ncbi:MAG TPA: hypothetical protein VMR34_02980 [Candidatus Saccharimonadales bacterium]|nr:hypothetical protein [Candidatus Saccharimonadales bacterium]